MDKSKSSSSCSDGLLPSSSGSTEAFIEDGCARQDPAKRKVEVILMVVLVAFAVVGFTGLAVAIVRLNDKINFAEQMLRLDVGLRPVANVHSPVANSGLPGPKDVSEEIPAKGLHLTGINGFLRINDDSGSVMETISNWHDKSMSGANGLLRLVDGSTIRVEEDGFYMIYAQITWRMKEGVAMFEISKSGGEATLETSSVSLAKCIESFHEEYAVVKSCFTSATVELRRGDSVQISVVNNDFSIDFGEGRSFFGAVKLDNVDSSKLP